jgi:hypothetical protein
MEWGFRVERKGLEGRYKERERASRGYKETRETD